MFCYDADYVLIMVNQRRKELIKEGDQARLLKAARLEQPCHRWTSRAANWLGAQLVEWGIKVTVCSAGLPRQYHQRLKVFLQANARKRRPLATVLVLLA